MQADSRPEKARSRTRRLPRSVRERQILDAAVRVFGEQGFHQASMDAISETAGISKPMIYAYLGSKDELFVACIRREATRLIDSLDNAVGTSSNPEQQLWRGLLVFFEYVGANRLSWTVLHRQAGSSGEPFTGEFVEWRSRIIGVIASLLAKATAESEQPMSDEQMQPFAAALVGAGESLLDWWVDHPEHTAEGLALRLMNLVWMGFGDLVHGRAWSPPTAE